jgi:hypothetical protein
MSNLGKKNGDLLAEYHNILNRWKNNSSRLFNVHIRSGVIQLNHQYLVPVVLRLKLLLRRCKSINRQN